MKIVEGHSSSTATTHTAGAEDPEVAKRAAIRPLLQRGRNERIGEFGLAKGPTHGDHDCLCKRIEARPRGNRFCSPAPPDVKRKTLMSEGRETKGEGGMGRGEREREKERERERRLERKSGSEAGRDAGRKTGWVRNVGSWSACLIFAISAPLKAAQCANQGMYLHHASQIEQPLQILCLLRLAHTHLPLPVRHCYHAPAHQAQQPALQHSSPVGPPSTIPQRHKVRGPIDLQQPKTDEDW